MRERADSQNAFPPEANGKLRAICPGRALDAVGKSFSPVNGCPATRPTLDKSDYRTIGFSFRYGELLMDDRLHGFQADFSFLLGVSFADPGHPATHGAGHVFIED
jgi:hypothetical protein